MTSFSSQTSPLMDNPDWQHCNEEELWHYVAWHLEEAGIYSVLVGGAVVAIYTEGIYKSGDLDIVPDDFKRGELEKVLAGIGFHPSRSRYYKHESCKHLVLEFPKGPVELGEEFPVIPDEIEWNGKIIRLLSPTDCVKDRLAGYIHWGARDCFEQALLVCKRQNTRIDFANIEKWCEREGGMRSFHELIKALRFSFE
jgi:hypothetical protein